MIRRRSRSGSNRCSPSRSGCGPPSVARRAASPPVRHQEPALHHLREHAPGGSQRQPGVVGEQLPCDPPVALDETERRALPVVDDHDLDIPVPAQNSPLTEKTRPHDREIPPPSFETVEITSAGRGMRALGDYYAQWGRIVLGSVHQLQGVNNAMVYKLHTQLDASRDQVDELVGAILNLRAAEMEIAEKQRSSDKTEDTRAEIAKHALQQLGDAAKAFLAARGVTPEMADVLGTLGQSPDLMATLNDPDVRILMQDGNNLKLLAGLLKQAAEQARAAREATTQAA